jgi:hypothetical protein
MELGQRKKFELLQKLDSLKLEFAEWRAKSQAAQELEKHRSQIHRITIQLEGLEEEIRAELEKPSEDASAILSRARELEVTMLEAHRVWEFFRSKLSLRYVKWFNPYLIAADELAYSCYHAAQKKLNQAYLSPEEVKEPPLVFFSGGSSPFTLPRNYAYQAEAVPGKELKAKKVFELLRALPVPVIGVPWFQIQYLPDALVLTHEVGHDVESDFKLTGDLTKALNQALADAKIDDLRCKAWRAWLSEIFADVFGVLATGPAFVQALMDFLATDSSRIMQARRSDPKWGLYPTDYLRVLVNLEVLKQQKFVTESKTLYEQWTANYPSHAMSEFAGDAEVVVKAILQGPYAAFGGTALDQVISFTDNNQYNATNDAVRLNEGSAPKTDSVRTLLASASIAFSLDPEKYRKKNVQSLILNHVKQIQASGPRGSQTTFVGKLGTLDAADKAAGSSLFKLLRNPSPANR